MVTASEALQVLSRLGADSTSGVYLRPGCDEHTVRELQGAAKRHLAEEVPASYVRMLRLTNGVQINGAFFKEAENLVPESLDVLHPEIIVLGNSGNMVEYVFDKRDRRFHSINMGFPDESIASFQTFEEMLARVLEEQGVA